MEKEGTAGPRPRAGLHTSGKWLCLERAISSRSRAQGSEIVLWRLGAPENTGSISGFPSRPQVARVDVISTHGQRPALEPLPSPPPAEWRRLLGTRQHGALGRVAEQRAFLSLLALKGADTLHRLHSLSVISSEVGVREPLVRLGANGWLDGITVAAASRPDPEAVSHLI